MKIEKVKCGHCDAEPSDADVDAAIAEHIDIFGKNCAVCSEPIKVLSVSITHSAYRDIKKWTTHVVIYEDYIELSFRPTSGGGSFMLELGKAHPECFHRLFPHAKLKGELR